MTRKSGFSDVQFIEVGDRRHGILPAREDIVMDHKINCQSRDEEMTRAGERLQEQFPSEKR